MNLASCYSGIFLKCTLYLNYSWEGWMSLRYHSETNYTFDFPPPRGPFFSKPHIHLLSRGQFYAQVHTHMHTVLNTLSYFPYLSSKLRPLCLPCHSAVRCLPASVIPAISLTNLKLLYGFHQCPRADFPLLALPNQSITLNCSITLVKS